MNDRDKMLDKLRKLFALGNSPNQHEAEAALRKASEIMQEYQISHADIDMREMGGIERGEEVIVANAGGSRHFVWVLGNASAKLFDGAAIHCGVDGEMRMQFVGTRQDIPAMKMMFEHLWKSWLSIADADLRREKQRVKDITIGEFYWSPASTMKYKHGHGVGFAHAINTRVDQIVALRRKEVSKTVTGRDLVVVKGQQLQNWMDRNTTKKGGGSSGGSHAGRNAGYAAGERIPLGGAVGGYGNQRQIGRG